jgi:hypothetical protein
MLLETGEKISAMPAYGGSLEVENSTPCEMAVKFCFFAYFTSLRNMAVSKAAVTMDMTSASDLLLLEGHHYSNMRSLCALPFPSHIPVDSSLLWSDQFV